MILKFYKYEIKPIGKDATYLNFLSFVNENYLTHKQQININICNCFHYAFKSNKLSKENFFNFL